MDLYRNILRTNHPNRKVLFHDPDYHWRWCPDFWPEPYRSQRRKTTGANLAEVRVEMSTLRDEVARALSSLAPPAGHLPNGNGAERKTSARVHVPASVRQKMRRRARDGK